MPSKNSICKSPRQIIEKYIEYDISGFFSLEPNFAIIFQIGGIIFSGI